MFTTQQIACTLVKLPQLPQLPQSFSPELFPRAGFRFYVPWVSRKPLEISIPRNIPQLTTNDDENAGGAVWVFEVWGFKIVQKACPAYPKWEPPWFPKWEPVSDIRDKVALGPSSFHKEEMCGCCPPQGNRKRFRFGNLVGSENGNLGYGPRGAEKAELQWLESAGPAAAKLVLLLAAGAVRSAGAAQLNGAAWGGWCCVAGAARYSWFCAVGLVQLGAVSWESWESWGSWES
jgi:hypothetical protein